MYTWIQRVLGFYWLEWTRFHLGIKYQAVIGGQELYFKLILQDTE